MQIYTDPKKCELLLLSSNYILLDSDYKLILNKYYNPDKYLFFSDADTLIPLVVKDNIVTFIGGTKHNHHNTFPNSPIFINEVLTYLKQHNYQFQLLSFKKDIFDILDSKYKKYDVPFPPEWNYNQPNIFDEQIFIHTFTGKERWSLKRVLKKTENYVFKTISFETFEHDFNSILQQHVNYYHSRNKTSVWKGDEKLLLDIIRYFNTSHKLLIRIIQNENKLVGIYIIVYNDTEMIFYFGGSLDSKDHYISKAIYFDMLNEARKLSKQYGFTELKGLRGSFSNKQRFHFKPSALYALVKDPKWIVSRDNTLTEELAQTLYKREFGVEQHEI